MLFCVGVTGSVWHSEKNIQGVPKILGKYQERFSNRKQKKNTCWQIVFELQPPRSPELNPSEFLSLGTLKTQAYTVGIGKEQALHQCVSRIVRPFATAPGTMKFCDSQGSHVRIDWVGGYLEHSL